MMQGTGLTVSEIKNISTMSVAVMLALSLYILAYNK